MTLKEAKKVAKVIGYADSGCRFCVDDLCQGLTKAELGFKFSLADGDADDERVLVSVEEA